ncbi:5'-nucleotidase C-terminal domain-containing protein [Flavobacteriales bacterium]|nr:5'-nucleotidase C-terminal domain-containing protein [Flavobacteriales bacterium]
MITTCVVFVLACQSYKIVDTSSTIIVVDKNIPEQKFDEIELSKYRDSISKEMNKVINHSLITMEVGCPEGLLGDFISDLSILYIKKNFPENKFNPDFCILNNGGFRNSLNKGSITIGDVFQIMPFDNYLLILEIKGNEMNDLINYIKEKSTNNISRKSGVPLSGIRLKISGDKVSRCMINNQMYDPLKTYKVLTTNYLASGGDNMDFFKNCKTMFNTKLLLRDVIIKYIEELGENNIKINTQFDGRVQIIQ